MGQCCWPVNLTACAAVQVLALSVREALEQTLATLQAGHATTGMDTGLQGGHSTDGASGGGVAVVVQ